MANAAEPQPSSFRWNIFNPFLPLINLTASFFSGSPTATQWKVTFRPMDRYKNDLVYAFFLSFQKIFDERTAITAENIFIAIDLDDARIATMDVPNYHFHSGNWYTLYFEGNYLIQPEMNPHTLVITIRILLPAGVGGIGNGTIFNADDLRWLSEDLRELFREQRYSRMRLMSIYDNPSPIRVHSYMIYARWDNFFNYIGYDEGNPNPVRLDIPRDLLLNILEYMYSGELSSPNWPDWANPAYTYGLFWLINRYNLYHLYKVFVPNDSNQERWTSDAPLSYMSRFPVYLLNGHLQANTSLWRIEQQDHGYGAYFQMQNRDENGRPWLSYIIRSESVGRVYIHVFLEVVEENEPDVFQRLHTLDDHCYDLVPNGSGSSGQIMFLGSPEIFGDHNLSQLYIRCCITITSGLTVEQFRGPDNHRQLVTESHSVLSDAMRGLLRAHVHHDMVANSSPIDVADVGEPLHKGIFVKRLPDYWRGIEDHTEEEPLRHSVTVRLSSDALGYVVDYIYTGRVFPIPRHLLTEIEAFANDTGAETLQDLLRRINSDRRNRRHR